MEATNKNTPVIEPYRKPARELRYCPTTADAEWWLRVTHRVVLPTIGPCFYGTRAQCEWWAGATPAERLSFRYDDPTGAAVRRSAEVK